MEMSLKHKNQDAVPQAFQRENQSSLIYPSRTIVHAKLEMTEPGDHDEQEADTMANTIVSGGKISRKISGGGRSSGIAVSQQMESQLSQLQGGGRQMPEGLRNMMESGFGQDFSQVRLHTDSEAASMSSSIHAKAFTLGNDIYFNQGQFSPNTVEGQRLVAHELTHVVQGSGKVGRYSLDKFLSDEKEWHDDNAVGIILDILSDIDSIASLVITQRDMKKIGITITKELSKLKKLKESLPIKEMPKHPVFDRIDTVSTVYCICVRAISIIRDIDMIIEDNKEYYAQLTLDVATLAADLATFPPIEGKLWLKCPHLAMVMECLSASLYAGDLINKTGITDYLAEVVFPFYFD